MAIENLYNTGIRPIGDESALAAPEKSIVVVGPARGGTSMVAGTLHHLGVFTGESSAPPVFEDLRMAHAFENGVVADVADVARAYDADHRVWAYKRPGVIENFGKVHGSLRNPIYLFIFKDPFSMANRNSISMNMDLVRGLSGALKGYEKVVGFIQRRQPNGLMLSYDRVMRNKEEFVDILTQVIAPQRVSDEQRSAALRFIDPNPVEYLNSSRITRGEGDVHELSDRVVRGAAWYVARPARPALVEVFVNGAKVGDADRGPALEDGRGYGFTYEFASPLGAADVVALKLSEDVVNFAEGLRAPA